MSFVMKSHSNLNREQLDAVMREGIHGGFNAMFICIGKEDEAIVTLPISLKFDSHSKPLDLAVVGPRNNVHLKLAPDTVVHRAMLMQRWAPTRVHELIDKAIEQKQGGNVSFVKRDGALRNAAVEEFTTVSNKGLCRYLDSSINEWRCFDVGRVLSISMEEDIVMPKMIAIPDSLIQWAKEAVTEAESGPPPRKRARTTAN